MKQCLWLIVLQAMFAPAFGQTTSAPTEKPLVWKAGAASVAITPEENLWMAGYSSRKKPAEGKAQDLFAKALALEDETGQRLVIVTMDFISVRRSVRDAVAARCLADHKLPPERLMMNASHTHCGPELSAPPGFEEKTKRYARFLEDALVQLVGHALERLAPADVSYAHARAGFAMNRRWPDAGTYKNHPNSDGPVDHDVPVLCVRDAKDKLVAVAFGYACHNTTLSSTTLPPEPPRYLFNGDYAGFAQQVLQQAYPEAVALFVMGCGGDQNPYPRNGEFPGKLPLEMAEHHGRSLASGVVTAMLAGSRPLSGPIEAVTGEVLLERNEGKPSDNYLIQAIRLGDSLTLVALGGEAVVDYSLRLKQEIKSPIVWIAGYSNEMTGYIPSRRVAIEGGYEAQKNYKLDVEQRIIGKVHELVGSLDKPAKGN
jgi:neutral ceramidase